MADSKLTHDVRRGDPITFSVVLSRLNSIADEMTIALENAAMTSILALVRDYSCCIHDRDGRQIAMVDALPIHTNSMNLMLEEIGTAFENELMDGDVIACNDPYRRNTHIGDLVIAAPVFVEGRHLFWTATRGHQLDVGAPVPHSANPFARSVWQEGMTIPPVKMVAGGETRGDVVELYLRNMRWRDLLEGDLRAQIGAVQTGTKRLKELCDRYSAEEILGYVEEALRYGDARTMSELQAMPDGTYTGAAVMDASGGDERNVRIQCTVKIDGGRVDVSFAGSDPEVDSGTNASYAVLQAAGGLPVIMAIDPDIPHNQGCLDRVTVSAPEGSVCNARFPTATAAATVLPADAMQEAVVDALASAIPDRIAAGCARWGNIPMLSGLSTERGAWGHQVGNGGGGGGGAQGVDGWPLISTPAAHGGLKTASVEHTELLYPLRIERWEIEPESMGMGQWLGGPGIRCAVRCLEGPVEVVGISDGLRNPPGGVAAGGPGAGGWARIERRDGTVEDVPPAYHFELQAGDVWIGCSSGGGGYGDPRLRKRTQISADVRDGLYRRETAESVFGVDIPAGDIRKLAASPPESEVL